MLNIDSLPPFIKNKLESKGLLLYAQTGAHNNDMFLPMCIFLSAIPKDARITYQSPRGDYVSITWNYLSTALAEELNLPVEHIAHGLDKLSLRDIMIEIGDILRQIDL